MTLVLKLLIKLVGLLTILISPNPTDRSAHLKKTKLIETLSNV